jgi:hypothetical protein
LALWAKRTNVPMIQTMLIQAAHGFPPLGVQGMAETGRLYGNPDALTFKLENAPMPSARGRRPLLTKYRLHQL